MGFFGDLKKKMGTGGVKVEITAFPQEIRAEDESVEIQVSISSEEHQELKNVVAGLSLTRTSETNQSNFGPDDNINPSSSTQTNTYVIAQVQMGQLIVEPMETKKFAVSIPLAELNKQVAKNNVELGESGMANLAEKFIASGLNGDYHDSYSFFASAEIEGFRDPSDSQFVNIAGAGNQGNFGFKIM